MNDVIDLIKGIIIAQYDKRIQDGLPVNREFFEGIELKNFCRESLKIIFQPIYGKPFDLTESSFDAKFQIALHDVRYTHPTIMTPSISLHSDNLQTWLTDIRIIDIGWNNDKPNTYRKRYLKYLSKIGRPRKVICETERSSLEIIKKFGDPLSEDDFFVKGLVVGNVQSGKTSNFNAVVNSSIDIGYKLIIIFSGLMEDLRRQTQIRAEKEVQGKMVRQGCFIGVGEEASFGPLGRYPEVNNIVMITSVQNDFSKQMLKADFSLNHTNILICKKNTSVLQNLLIWLKQYLAEDRTRHNIPLLVIDDEADNASLNNKGAKGEEFATTINGHIRALLAMFSKKTYLGYTATPFANVLQDYNRAPVGTWKIKKPDSELEFIEFNQVGNLFPDDFIELLIPPSNYLGPKHFFETRIEEVKKIETLIAPPLTDYYQYFPERVEILADGSLLPVKRYKNRTEFDSDDEAKAKFETFQNYRDRTRSTRKDDKFPDKLPPSLIESILCFIISIAIRLSRRSMMHESPLYNKHNSMLIHISRYTSWQSATKVKIIELIDNLTHKLNHDNYVSPDSIFHEFQRVWMKYYSYTINNIQEYLPYDDDYLGPTTFEVIRDYLVMAVNGIDVKAINVDDKDLLDYEKGEKKYIVIGGNRLSRGFTLEGLTINYFIRNTDYADTLLQMGRWFGYRPGYIDCCKLFTTKDSLEKFDLCTWTIEELEEEFKRMSKNHKKPKDFALKVLNHPGVLKITRPAILKNAREERWSFEDKLVQTTELKLTNSTITNSWTNFKKMFQSHASSFKYDENRGFIIIKTDLKIVKDFIDTQVTITDQFDKEALLRFITKCQADYGKLINWTIAIKTTGSARILDPLVTGFPTAVQRIKRSTPLDENNKFYIKLKEENIFRASGNASTLIANSKDLAVTLSETEILNAQSDFSQKYPGKNFPEWIYRERIAETDGLMVVYLMDLLEIFNNEELNRKASKEGIDTNIPLIGIAIGIPPLEEDIGADYLINKNINPTTDLDDENNDDDELAGIINE